MKILTQKMLVVKFTATLLIVLYSAISFSANLPFFHNHGFFDHKTCYDHSCSTSIHDHQNSVLEIQLSILSEPHLSCITCQWQAMAKKNCINVLPGALIVYSVYVSVTTPNDKKHISAFYFLPDSRAPPIS